MTSVVQKHRDGPRTYAVSTVVDGGQFVSADQTQTTVPTVKLSGAGDTTPIGVALEPAAPAGTDSATDAAARPTSTAVAVNGQVRCNFAAASHLGDRLKVAATGQVTPIAASTDIVVGVTADATVASGGVGLVDLNIKS